MTAPLPDLKAPSSGAAPARPKVRIGQTGVLRVARAHFLADGFSATSMQAIADDAGLTKAALYYHFKDKEDLFAAVVGAEMADMHTAIERVIEGDGPLRDRLAATASFILRTASGDIGRLMTDMQTCLSPGILASVKAGQRMPEDVLGPHLRRAAEAGELAPDLDPSLLATFFFGLVFTQVTIRRGAAVVSAPDGVTRRSPEEVGAAIARVFLTGARP